MDKSVEKALKATSLEASNPYQANSTIRQLRQSGRVGVLSLPAQLYESLSPAAASEMLAQVALLGGNLVVENPYSHSPDAYYIFRAASPKFEKSPFRGDAIFKTPLGELPHYFIETWRLESGLLLKVEISRIEDILGDDEVS